MSGRHKWSDLRKTASPEALARAEALTQQMLAEMPLHDLRRALALSQQTMAQLLDTSQSEISKIEHRTDSYISTVRRYVEAMGGKLDLVARFPTGEVRINQFEQIAGEAPEENLLQEV